jgi:hypothetical protein
MSINLNGKDVSKAGCTEPPSKKCDEGSSHIHLLPNMTYSDANLDRHVDLGDECDDLTKQESHCRIKRRTCRYMLVLIYGRLNDESDGGNWGKVRGRS